MKLFNIIRSIQSRILFLCVIQAASSCSSTVNTILSPEDLDEIRGYSRQYVEAMQKNDWPAVAESFTLDAIRMPPNVPIQKGRAEIENSFAPIDRILSYEVNFEDVQGGSGIAFIHASFTITLVLSGVEVPINDFGKAIEIWKKESDGHWRMAVAIWNSDLPLVED